MPQPPFGPDVDEERRRERILALSRRIFDLAEGMTEDDDNDPETLAAIAHMERIMMAIRMQAFVRRRARARVRRNNDDDDGVVNAQLPREEGW